MYGGIEAKSRAVEGFSVGGATFHSGRGVVYPRSFPGFTPMIMTLFALDWYYQYILSWDKLYPCMTALAQASLEPFYQWLSAISARKTE